VHAGGEDAGRASRRAGANASGNAEKRRARHTGADATGREPCEGPADNSNPKGATARRTASRARHATRDRAKCAWQSSTKAAEYALAHQANARRGNESGGHASQPRQGKQPRTRADSAKRARGQKQTARGGDTVRRGHAGRNRRWKLEPAGSPTKRSGAQTQVMGSGRGHARASCLPGEERQANAATKKPGAEHARRGRSRVEQRGPTTVKNKAPPAMSGAKPSTDGGGEARADCARADRASGARMRDGAPFTNEALHTSRGGRERPDRPGLDGRKIRGPGEARQRGKGRRRGRTLAGRVSAGHEGRTPASRRGGGEAGSAGRAAPGLRKR